MFHGQAVYGALEHIIYTFPMTTPNNARPGRNEPCPCGSGRKYKHCCLAKDEKKDAAARAKAAKEPERASVRRGSFRGYARAKAKDGAAVEDGKLDPRFRSSLADTTQGRWRVSDAEVVY